MIIQAQEDPQNRITGYVMIESLRIKNFRCFKSLKLDGLRRINIVVGDNASGKTVLLEAIKLGLDGFPTDLPWLNQMRNIMTVLPANPTQEQFQSPFVDLFHLLDTQTEIVISIRDSQHRTATLLIHFDPSRATTLQTALDFQPSIGPSPSPSAPSPLPTTIVPLAFERNDFEGQKSTLLATLNPQGQLHLEAGKTMGIVSGLISSIHFGVPAENASWFSQLRIEKRGDEVIQPILRQFPFIAQLTIETPVPGIGGTIYADLRSLPRKIPLSLVSGGISRLFTMVLAADAFKGGVLLIDEIENGIFHQTYPFVWKTLVDVAEHQQTQLFISTHSKECLAALMPVLSEIEKDVTLMRLTKQNSQSEVLLFSGKDLRSAIEQKEEFR